MPQKSSDGSAGGFTLWKLALLVSATVAVYLPSLWGGFIWDDDHFLTKNPLIRASDGLYRFWFTREAPDFWPLSSSSLWIEWRWWGLDPAGYHATNLALHVTAAILLWAILRRLQVPAAFLAALIFALHPVNVESVAWITQRKNALAMVFYLISILCFLRMPIRGAEVSPARPSPAFDRWYYLSLIAFVLAMLSKASVVILPLVLVVLIGWRLRWSARHLIRALSFIPFAAGLAAINLWFQNREPDAVGRHVDFAQRLSGAGAAVWFYLSKSLLPTNLNFVYRQWHIEPQHLLWWVPLAAAIAVTVGLWWGARRLAACRPVLFAWAYFCIALAPALGFADAYFMKYSLVADHYQHLAMIGVIVLAVAGWSRWRRIGRAGNLASVAVAAVVVAALGIMTWQRNRLFADAPRLYRSVIEDNPDCWMAWNELGLISDHAGKPGEARSEFETALRLNPDFAEAHNNLGNVFGAAGRWEEAAGHYRTAVKIDPAFAEAQNNFGNALVQLGRPDEAFLHYDLALGMRPEFAEAHNNLANLLRRTGRIEMAVEHYRRALSLDAKYPEAWNGLGNALRAQGKTEEAIAAYHAALRFKPDYAVAHNSLGAALASAGREEDALAQYRAALALKPDYREAHYNAGLALRSLGRPEEAREEMNAAERLGGTRN